MSWFKRRPETVNITVMSTYNEVETLRQRVTELLRSNNEKLEHNRKLKRDNKALAGLLEETDTLLTKHSKHTKYTGSQLEKAVFEALKEALNVQL